MKRSAILLVGLIGVLVLGTVTVSAQATKTEFEAQESLVPTGPPGKVWVSDDGVVHIRDLTVVGPVWGDIVGQLTVVANINQDTATGDGTAYGTAVLEVESVEWGDLSGTFEGRSQWKLAGGLIVTGQFVGHGTGDFEGMHMQANFFNAEDGTTPLIGTIHNPHGE
jgi:hypothetical protein